MPGFPKVTIFMSDSALFDMFPYPLYLQPNDANPTLLSDPRLKKDAQHGLTFPGHAGCSSDQLLGALLAEERNKFVSIYNNNSISIPFSKSISTYSNKSRSKCSIKSISVFNNKSISIYSNKSVSIYSNNSIYNNKSISKLRSTL